MNENQIKFHDFFMSMVREEKKIEAEDMLAVGFQMQENGTFTSSYLNDSISKYQNLIKPECESQLIKALYLFATEMIAPNIGT